MSIPIKTNQLQFVANVRALSDKYDLYQIATNEKYFKSGAKILDVPLLNGEVVSLLFESGNIFYLMVNCGKISISQLKKILEPTAEAKTVTIVKKEFSSISEDKLIQLLMNSLGNFKSEFLRFSNLTGHLYCFHPAWLKHSKKEQTIWQVPCLEIKITKDLCLEFPVRTFTSVKMKSKMMFGKRKFAEYPQYVLTSKNTLRRKLDNDTGNSFLLHQIDGNKTNIPFLVIKNEEAFNQSKMGMLFHIFLAFNTQFADVASLELKEIDQYSSVEYTRVCAKENVERIRSYLSENEIHIIDTIKDEYSETFCKEIQSLLKRKYDVDAVIREQISNAALNIRLIHNAEYYNGIEDQHEIYADAVVQHITFEDFARCAEFAIDTVVHELLIKRDLIQGKISLFDWRHTKLCNDVAFGIPAMIMNKEKYLFMTVHPDGNFEIVEEGFDLFHIQQYQDCIEIFEDAKIKGENIRGLIRTYDGKIEIIKDTGWMAIPEIKRIQKELSMGNTKIRGKKARTELLSACVDIKAFEQGNSAYYFVGIKGEGMYYTINWASNIRKIEPYKDASLMYQELLPLMNVTFVHNGQLTAIPFPFKYLREYALIRQ